MNILTSVCTPFTLSKTRKAEGASTRIHRRVSRTMFESGIDVAVESFDRLLYIEVGEGTERFVETDVGTGGARREE